MASFSLIPDPSVMGVQVGVFLASYVAIKKLFVEPYMALRDKREVLTVGSKDEAARALAASDQVASKIEQRLATVNVELKAERERLREQALGEKDRLIAAAQAAAKSEVASVEGLIAADLAAERAKIPAIIATLTDEVYALALA